MKYLFFFAFLWLLLSCTSAETVTEAEVAGQYVGPIIDMHVHAYNAQIGGMMFGMDHPNPLKNEVYKAVQTPEEQRLATFQQFDSNNIVLALTSDGQFWHKYDPDRIWISGRNMPIDSLKTLHANGNLKAIGELNPFYGGIQADHPSQAPFFELAEELGVPVGFHIMPGGPPGGIYHMGMHDIRVANANPKQLEEVLVKHPNLKVFVMHGGWPYLEDMKAMLYAHPQLYLDLAAICWILPEAELHHFIGGLIDAGFGNRIMFGSDQMVWPETIRIGIEAIQSATFLSVEQKADIFYNNAATFLGVADSIQALHHSSN